ncbi:hypothetical protein [Arenibacter certesii]|uniref:Uncharacterized protein n=1 Tax=Arenibacter certesii TaxID=228955 RepID=A0A918IMU3_9FLAO|nr:hypothetical protein [Arenibacter certesii]GGW23409.1 hypothetical protein GCM10007383_04470 [Arenibacter certesii]
MKTGTWRIPALIVAMSLATAWAIRGQFGHEQGAAWAGGIGGVALVLVSRRQDWYRKMMVVALASGIGWGAGGMISYGMIVGYGKADNFINAFYGLGMLFVIGGLFGWLGGGLVGLTLDSTKENRVKWGALITEMTVGGLLTYYLLVEQIGVKMTPPRSEAWAVCLGAALAMLWHMAREKRLSAIRVAFFSMLGAGIGFGLGNFLQVLGITALVSFNMWNVMEYSIGFFGGLGMAYGVFSSKWPMDIPEPKKWENWSAWVVIALFIPLIVYRESLSYAHFARRLKNLPNLESLATISTVVAAVVLFLMMILLYLQLRNRQLGQKEVFQTLFILLVPYMLVSYIVKGIFGGIMEATHHLYLLNILILILLLRFIKAPFSFGNQDSVPIKKWSLYLLVAITFMALLALLAITLHGDIGGHNRFPLD